MTKYSVRFKERKKSRQKKERKVAKREKEWHYEIRYHKEWNGGHALKPHIIIKKGT